MDTTWQRKFNQLEHKVCQESTHPWKFIEAIYEQLSFNNGNSGGGATKVLYKYYKAKCTALNNQRQQSNSKDTKSNQSTAKSLEERFKEALQKELSNAKLVPLLKDWDQTWYDATVNHYKGMQTISERHVEEMKLIIFSRRWSQSFHCILKQWLT